MKKNMEDDHDQEIFTSGRFYIWIITCILFMSVILGGSFLVMYLILPPTPSTEWLPIVGVSLVCLPWGFWFFTCIYRVLSRAFGFRVVIGGGGGGNGNDNDNGNGNGRGSTSSKDSGSPLDDSREKDDDDPVKNHQFAGNVVTMGENGDGGKEGGHGTGIKRTSSSANGVSIGSHESELPLTSAVGS